jgi:hypothetical protein
MRVVRERSLLHTVAICIFVLSLVLTACAGPTPTEAPAEAPAEAPTEAPAEVPTEAPTEAPAEPEPSPNQAPMLAELVASGDLPPLEERLPENPMVVEWHLAPRLPGCRGLSCSGAPHLRVRAALAA